MSTNGQRTVTSRHRLIEEVEAIGKNIERVEKPVSSFYRLATIVAVCAGLIAAATLAWARIPSSETVAAHGKRLDAMDVYHAEERVTLRYLEAGLNRMLDAQQLGRPTKEGPSSQPSVFDTNLQTPTDSIGIAR